MNYLSPCVISSPPNCNDEGNVEMDDRAGDLEKDTQEIRLAYRTKLQGVCKLVAEMQMSLTNIFFYKFNERKLKMLD